MSQKILQETLSYLKKFYSTKLESLKITDIFTEELFTIIKLNNGSQGIAMNYNPDESTAENISSQIKEDPLLINFLFDKGEINLSSYSLMTAVISALSQKFLNNDFLNKFNLKIERGGKPLSSLTKKGDSITIIGFGGFLKPAIYDQNIENIYIADLYYSQPEQKRRFQQEISQYSEYLKDKSLSLHDGSDNKEIIKKSNIVCITGSALSNGTMDELLGYSKGSREVIIQGHSASILPIAFFDNGATLIIQTLIDIDILSLAKRFRDQKKYNEQPLMFGNFMDMILPTKVAIYKTIKF